MARIYHITTRQEADDAARTGEYAPRGFERDGFVHCSRVGQVPRVASFLFRGRDDLEVLEIDPARLRCEVVEENLEGGEELFPHVYGRVPMRAVVKVHDFPCREDGTFGLPGMDAEGRMRLFPRRSTWLWVLAGSVVFVAAGIEMAAAGEWVGWLAIVFFGLGIPVAVVQHLSGSAWLEIGPEGLTMRIWFREGTLAWSEVEEFCVLSQSWSGVRVRERVGIRLAPSPGRVRIGRWMARSGRGCDGMLPDSYGRKAEDLAACLNACLAEFRRRGGAGPPGESGTPGAGRVGPPEM